MHSAKSRPGVHRRVLGNVGFTPVRRRTEFAASCDLVLLIGVLTAEDRADTRQSSARHRDRFPQKCSGNSSRLRTGNTQHGALGLTEVDPKRLTLGVQRLDQIDRGYPAGVPDHQTFIAADLDSRSNASAHSFRQTARPASRCQVAYNQLPQAIPVETNFSTATV